MDKKLLIDYFNRCAKDRRKRRRRNHYYYEQLESYFEFIIPQGSSVLEIGCGTGETLNALKPARGLGIDFCPEMVRLARNEFPHLEFRVEDIEELKTTEKFDYVILSDLVGLLLDVQTAFNQLKKVCSARTRVIIVNYNYLWEPVLKLAEKIGLRTPQLLQNWLSLPDIENLLYLSNFEVIKKGCRVLLPIYIPIVSTLFNKFISKLPLLSRLSLVQIIIARPKPFSVVEDNYSCSVVIACRNELGNIRPTIERIPKMGSHTEIIFVEGHSKDGTLLEINGQIKNFPEKDIKVLIQDGIGKGDAVHKGFSHAKGDILMVLDADLTVYPEELQKFYDTLASGKAEFAMGSRLVYPIEEGAMRFLNLVGNKFFSIVFSYLLEQRIKDTLCANKAFFRRDYKKIEMVRDLLGNFDPFGDFDLIFGAAKYNLKILEIPVRYNPRIYGTTQISRFSHGWLLLKMCWIAFWRLKIK
ncbi:MAG: glycosyltransferase [Candidatus Omnitrophica bacterium]|nr:glycosyltransferase [Candidatus Omnitrophota bacterium]MDD5238820.1 glycosyltransferase [Candidatus Omnitrophota bacterium]